MATIVVNGATSTHSKAYFVANLTESETIMMMMMMNRIQNRKSKYKIPKNANSISAVPFRGPPRYNPRRRSGLGWGSTLSRIYGGPPSPCPSEHPFSSASSSLSEGSSSHRSHEDDISIVTGKWSMIMAYNYHEVK